MRSRCVNKYLALLLVLSLLGLAFAGPRISRAASEKNADKRVQDLSSQQNAQESQDQDDKNKFDESKTRVKRQVITENNNADVLEDVEGTDLIQKLGVDGALRRVKRQGDWRDHPYYRDRYEDSDSSDDDDDDSDDDDDDDDSEDSTDSEDSDSTTDDSTDSSDTSSDSSSDSDDERRRRRRRRRRHWRRGYYGGWGGW